MILFKNPIQYDTLYIVRYLHSLGYHDSIPKMIIERNYPVNVIELPTLFVDNEYFYGLTNIILYYEKKYNITNLLEKSIKFNEENPNYKIRDS
jgi:hypothetical protein